MDRNDNPYMPPNGGPSDQIESQTTHELPKHAASWKRNLFVILFGWLIAAGALPAHSPTWIAISASLFAVWAVWYMWSHR
ncbi:MAG: hypothetical protein AAGG48_29970 [Planctomycetota bacterium]